MHLKKYDFKNLPFSTLFQRYVEDFTAVADFYETNPFDLKAVQKRAQSIDFMGNRKVTGDLLKSFNERFDIDDKALQNIERLQNPKALAIVTGQQLGVYGGPVYTFFKTLTTIHLAKRLESELEQPVIPIFWLADEDHDYEEIRSIGVLNDAGVESFSLDHQTNGLPPVSDIEMPDGIKSLATDLRSTLIDTDFSDELWNVLDDSFTSGATFREAFGQLIASLFSKYGLVLAGSNNPAIKQQLKAPMITAVRKADEVREALEKQSQKIGDQFHEQATIYDSHLFYLHPQEGRLKIERDDEHWITEADQKWSSKQLIDEVASRPELFSPDVFLRPVLQDRLLPTLGYVAGPGEVAYYGQMKSFYGCFNQQMPVIFPRMSATFIEPAIDRIFHELPFELHQYNNRIEDLESDFIEQTCQTDVEQIFGSWKEEAESASGPHINQIVSVDDTLEGAAEKAMATYFNALDELKGKTYRAVKKQEAIQLNRIRRIHQNLFPDRELQERTLGGIYFMNKFGMDVWDRLLNEMSELDSLKKHQLIYL